LVKFLFLDKFGGTAEVSTEAHLNEDNAAGFGVVGGGVRGEVVWDPSD
jgi:hypothetical protein